MPTGNTDWWWKVKVTCLIFISRIWYKCLCYSTTFHIRLCLTSLWWLWWILFHIFIKCMQGNSRRGRDDEDVPADGQEVFSLHRDAPRWRLLRHFCLNAAGLHPGAPRPLQGSVSRPGPLPPRALRPTNTGRPLRGAAEAAADRSGQMWSRTTLDEEFPVRPFKIKSTYSLICASLLAFPALVKQLITLPS